MLIAIVFKKTRLISIFFRCLENNFCLILQLKLENGHVLGRDRSLVMKKINNNTLLDQKFVFVLMNELVEAWLKITLQLLFNFSDFHFFSWEPATRLVSS